MLNDDLRIKFQLMGDKQFSYSEADGDKGLTIHFDDGRYILSEVDYADGTSILYTLAEDQDVHKLKMVADFYVYNHDRFAEKIYWQPNTKNAISALTSLGMITIRRTSKGWQLDLPDEIRKLTHEENNALYQYIDTAHQYAESIFEEAKAEFKKKWKL